MLARCDLPQDRRAGARGRACRRVRKRCEFHAHANAFTDAQCRAGGEHIAVTYPLAYSHTDARGGASGAPARSGYVASDDIACRTASGRLVLSAQQ